MFIVLSDELLVRNFNCHHQISAINKHWYPNGLNAENVKKKNKRSNTIMIHREDVTYPLTDFTSLYADNLNVLLDCKETGEKKKR